MTPTRCTWRARSRSPSGASTRRRRIPRVGCVIVDDGRIVGEGWHESAGGRARRDQRLRDAKARGDARGATLYVTLEPCNHGGRTTALHRGARSPPASRASSRRWPIRTRSRGAAPRAARRGHRVDIGPARARRTRSTRASCAHDARAALGADEGGREPRRPHGAADGRSQWITGEAARADGHAWRARACAILTGIGTVQADNPRLTVRAVATPRQPLRIVVDRHAETPRDRRRSCAAARWS